MPGWPNLSLKWDRAALECFGDTISTEMMRGLRQRALRAGQLPSWSESRTALDGLFGELGSKHFLAAPSISWGIVFTEPQITQGWRYFLDPASRGDFTARRRCAAFLAAIEKGSGDRPLVTDPTELNELSVAAEAQTQGIGKSRYIDLLLTWKTGDGIARGAAIEFKFGHHLSQYQLSDYRRSLRRTLQPEHMKLYVVAPSARPRDAISVRRNRSWSFTTWHALLRSLGPMLAVGDVDDDDFRQFRRTVWARAEQGA